MPNWVICCEAPDKVTAMRIQISDDALDLARRKGNFIALDFITPVG